MFAKKKKMYNKDLRFVKLLGVVIDNYIIPSQITNQRVFTLK